MNSFKLQEEEIKRAATGIASKGTSITMKLREIDSIVRQAVSEVNSLAEVPNFGYEPLEGSIREIENLTEKIRRFVNIADEYNSEVDREFFNGQEKVTNDLSNLVLNEIEIYDDLNLKSKVQSYGRYGAGSVERQMITLDDILNESSVKYALKDSYEKNLEEIKKLKEFAELDINTLGEGYTEDDKQKLRDAQNQIKEYLKAVDADELMAITYEQDLEKFLTSDKMNYVTRGERALSTVLDFVPVVGNVKGLAEAITGQNLITGEKLSTGERVLTGIFSCLGLGAEGAFVKNIGKVAVKDGLKGAVKFGGKETLKDMSKNAAFYGGSVALSEAGIDQKYQLGLMAAVTVVGHGKNIKAGVSKTNAVVSGVSKGSFLDALRINDKAAYKKAMVNLRQLTYNKSVVISCNGVGEIDKLFKNNKSLRGFIQKLDKLKVTESQKVEIYKIFMDEDFDLQKKMKKYIDCDSMEGIYNVIDTYQKRSEWRVHLSNKYSADGVYTAMDEMTLIKSVTKKLEQYVDNMDDVAKKKYAKTAVAFDSKNLDTISIATSNSHEYNSSILTEGEVFNKCLFEKLLNKYEGDESVAYSMYYENTLSENYILNSISDEFFINRGLSRDKVIKEMRKLTDSIENTKIQAVESGEFSCYTGNPSFEVWNVENCAEVWSIRKAILNGADFYDISFKCIESLNKNYAKPCGNCKRTFRKLNNIGKVDLDVRR